MGRKNMETSVSALYSDTVQGLRTDLRNRDSPITSQVVLAICLVFLGQEIAAALLGTSVHRVTSYFFLEYPLPAWLLSFFLHRDLTHFFVNIGLIGFVGHVVERSFSKRAYLLFLVGTAVLSGIGAFLFRALFTAKPVAAYGASGFGYAIAAYSVYFVVRDGGDAFGVLSPQHIFSDVAPSERIAIILGISAVIAVVWDLLSGPYLTVEWANGAHVVGVVVGLIVGRIHPPTKRG